MISILQFHIDEGFEIIIEAYIRLFFGLIRETTAVKTTGDEQESRGILSPPI